MCIRDRDEMKLKSFSQKEYSNLLDELNARKRELSQTECEAILVSGGATHMQAKNAAYVYIHHGSTISATRRVFQSEYDCLLDGFDAKSKPPQDCIRYLETHGFSYGQAHTAVYKYRVKCGLIRK